MYTSEAIKTAMDKMPKISTMKFLGLFLVAGSSVSRCAISPGLNVSPKNSNKLMILQDFLHDWQ
jgi:hypothetical protein